MSDRFNDEDPTQTTASTEAAVSDPPPADVSDEAAGTVGSAKADPIEELQREKDVLQDRLLRLAAEFDNYRKRIDRDRRDQSEAAIAGALEDLLPILDNLERALEAPPAIDADIDRQGIELIRRQMVELVRKRGVTPIETVGAEFDPRIHQAVAHEYSPDHREGEVTQELRRGYMLGDRLLRPAMVKVAKSE
jgi:molecular chaperone GrpE